jgi:predicted transcriptional regulator
MAEVYVQTSDPRRRVKDQSLKLQDNVNPIERRDKLEIILAILEIAQQPIRKTHILYSAKINFYQLTRYLSLLVAVQMIEEVSEPIEGYRITDRGRLLLSMFEQS